MRPDLSLCIGKYFPNIKMHVCFALGLCYNAHFNVDPMDEQRSDEGWRSVNGQPTFAVSPTDSPTNQSGKRIKSTAKRLDAEKFYVTDKRGF